MTGPLYPPADRATHGGPSSGPSTGGLPLSASEGAARSGSPGDPALVPDLQVWLGDVVKAVKGFRVYADNNEMLLKFVDHAFVGLEFLLGRDPELTLSIREDRILYGKEVVHVSTDRDEGLPFLLYRNAFRRIVLVRGMTRDELVGLMRAFSTDFASYDHTGEDLVTTLWRLQLPHVRYLTIDALSSSKSDAGDDQERAEIERIQGDIENIVAAIYKTGAADDDLVAGVSISQEDLEALRTVRAESPEDLEMLDHATERAIIDVPDGQLKRVQDDLQSENREELTRSVLNILIQILFRETSSQQSAMTIDLIQQLFDAMVLARRYRDATQLLYKLREYADSGETMQEVHVARHLLGMFAADSKVFPVLSTLNEQHYSVSSSELFEFLKALGPSVSPILVRALDSLTSPAHRRATCDLIVQLGVPSLADLATTASSAKWFVVRDILGLAQQYPLTDIGALVSMGLNHEHPRVRQLAVGMLRGYGRGAADQALAGRVHDEDIEVRLAAYRVAAARRSRDVMPALEQVLNDDKLSQREVRELRLLMAAYAAIGGISAIGVLSTVLNAGLIASLTNTDAQVAAAYALASIGPEAAGALQRGARTLNPKVREACRRALGRDLQRRQAQRELLRGRLPGTTEAERPLSEAVPTSSESPTASIDVDFRVSETGSIDPLADAPPLRINAPLPEAPPMAVPPAGRPRPPIPRVDGPSEHPDEVPMNLPPPPSRDLPASSTGEIPLGDSGPRSSGRLNVLGDHSVDMVPNNLPPAPGGGARTFDTLPEPPPVVGSDPSAPQLYPPTTGERSPITPGSTPPELLEPPIITGPLGEVLPTSAAASLPVSGASSMPSESSEPTSGVPLEPLLSDPSAGSAGGDVAAPAARPISAPSVPASDHVPLTPSFSADSGRVPLEPITSDPSAPGMAPPFSDPATGRLPLEPTAANPFAPGTAPGRHPPPPEPSGAATFRLPAEPTGANPFAPEIVPSRLSPPPEPSLGTTGRHPQEPTAADGFAPSSASSPGRMPSPSASVPSGPVTGSVPLELTAADPFAPNAVSPTGRVPSAPAASLPSETLTGRSLQASAEPFAPGAAALTRRMPSAPASVPSGPVTGSIPLEPSALDSSSPHGLDRAAPPWAEDSAFEAPTSSPLVPPSDADHTEFLVPSASARDRMPTDAGGPPAPNRRPTDASSLDRDRAPTDPPSRSSRGSGLPSFPTARPLRARRETETPGFDAPPRWPPSASARPRDHEPSAAGTDRLGHDAHLRPPRMPPPAPTAPSRRAPPEDWEHPTPPRMPPPRSVREHETPPGLIDDLFLDDDGGKTR